MSGLLFASQTMLRAAGESARAGDRRKWWRGSRGVVTLSGGGYSRTAVAAADGTYSFADLPTGNYTVQASATGLALPRPAKVSLNDGAQMLNLVLNVAASKQEVTVEETGRPTVSTEASANASAVVIQGSDLDALSDNPDDLLADLQALAGPAAGPNGGSIFIEGFSGGQLPPKNAIREIRINQNPFSPEYDKLGFGRIEIFTKPERINTMAMWAITLRMTSGIRAMPMPARKRCFA